MAVLTAYTTRVIKVTYISTLGYTFKDSKGFLDVQPITARTSAITWSNLPLDTPDETFYIQKSGNPVSGWVHVAKATASDPFVVDIDANNTLNRHDIEYYRLVAPNSQLVLGVAKVEGYIDLYGAEIARRHRILLEHGLAGNKTYTFIRMRSGTRCPECWDEILQQRSRVDCETCKDTGYIQGYYNPIETWVSFSDENTSISGDLDGPDVQPDKLSAWTSNYPLLNVGDIIMEPHSHRFWEVQSVHINTHKRCITKQELVIVKQEGDDPLLALYLSIPKEDINRGQSVFEDDSPYSEGIYDCVAPELLP